MAGDRSPKHATFGAAIPVRGGRGKKDICQCRGGVLGGGAICTNMGILSIRKGGGGSNFIKRWPYNNICNVRENCFYYISITKCTYMRTLSYVNTRMLGCIQCKNMSR